MKNKTNCATIDSLDIDELIAMKKKQEYLKMHPYAIWQSKDGKYWYTTLPDKTKERGVRQIRRSSKAELEKVIAEYWESNANKKTIDEIYQEWSQNRLNIKKITMSTHIREESIYRNHLCKIGTKAIDSMKPIDWCDYLENELISTSMSKGVFSFLKTIIFGIVKWAYRRDYIDYTPSDIKDYLEIPPNLFKESKKNDKEDVYNEEEAPLIVNYLINNKDLLNWGLLLMFITGIRPGELLSLKHGAFVDRFVRISCTMSSMLNENGKVCRNVKDKPKTFAGFRNVIVPDSFRWLIDYFADGNPDEYIFLTSRGNIIRHDMLGYRLKKICEELNIPYRSPHKIRKTYGSLLLDRNAGKRFVMEQMGHSDIRCTEEFYHRNRKTEEKKEEIIDSLGEFYNITET